MNKEAITRTAVCRFDKKERVYIVESPLCDRVMGAAKTEKAARRIFAELLQETYVAYLEGRLAGYDKPGRPAKNRANVHLQVKPETRDKMRSWAGEYGISQGEMLDYVIAAHAAREGQSERSET